MKDRQKAQDLAKLMAAEKAKQMVAEMVKSMACYLAC
jgi:hypothetical protein